MAIAESIIGAGISAAGGIISSAMSSSAAGNLNADNRRWQEKMNDYNWNRAVEYNDPSAVIKRYTDAGVNPYAAVAAATGQTSTMQPTSTPSPSNNMGDYSGISQGLSAAGSQIAQYQLMEAQARNLNADAEGKEIENEKKPEMLVTQIKTMNQGIKESNARIRNILAQAEGQETHNQNIDNLDKSQIGANNSQTLLNDAKIKQVNQEVINSMELIQQGWNELDARRDEIEIRRYEAQSGRITANANARNAATNASLAAYEKQLKASTTKQIEANINILKKQGYEIDARCYNLYASAYAAYAQGNYTNANTKWQEFQNRVQEINGAEFYANADKHKDDNVVSSTTLNAASAVNQTMQAAKTGVDIVKPWK